jgi:hypothetical protein
MAMTTSADAHASRMLAPQALKTSIARFAVRKLFLARDSQFEHIRD